MADTKTCQHCNTSHPLTSEFWYIRQSKERSGNSYPRYTCRTYRKLQALLYYQDNKDRRLNAMRQYQLAAVDKIAYRKQKHRQANLARIRAAEAQKTRKRKRATPPWADLAAIKEFYKNCPEGYQVDHIIPLCGKDVCGLHVLENLQYLTARENMAKGNKWPIV